MRKALELGLVALIALACAFFAAVLVRGPARREEGTLQGAWRAWKSRRGGTNANAERGVEVLARDQVLRLPGWREGSSVRVEAGIVIVTREGDPEDHVLRAGAQLRVPGRGLALAWAQEPSRVEIRRGGAERAGGQAPALAPVSLAR